MDVYLNVSRLIRTIREKILIDLMVCTEPDFKRVIKLNSVFIQEIMENVKVLIG